MIDGQAIAEVKIARFLGVWINRRGQFSAHGAKTKEAMQNRINFIRALAPKANRSSLWKISNAVCISKLMYGIELFGMDITSTLQPIFNELLRITSGAFKTSPTFSLAVEAGELPLDLRITETFIRKYCRLAEKTNHDYPHYRGAVNSILLEISGITIPDISKLQRIGRRPWNSPRIKVDWFVKNAFKKGGNVAIARTIVQERLLTKYPNHTKIFTDGSKTSDAVGIGVVGPRLLVQRSLQNQCSIYSAEAAALVAAARYAPKKPTVILSDSASCMAAIDKGESNHPFVQEFENIASRKNIVACWIPGHSGIPGNEAADQAAERGRTGRTFYKTLPSSDVIRWIRGLLRDSYQARWDSHRSTFLQACKPMIGKWTDRPDRREQRILTRLRIGHTLMTKKHLFDRMTPNTCETCNSELTVEHILLSCKKYENIREEVGLSNNILVVLGNNSENETKTLKFVKKCRLDDI